MKDELTEEQRENWRRLLVSMGSSIEDAYSFSDQDLELIRRLYQEAADQLVAEPLDQEGVPF